MADWCIEPLASHHERSAFSCGLPLLDDFLIRLASQFEKRNYARTFVVVEAPSPAVIGYYSLSAGAVALDILPADKRKKLPRHPAPVAHLGRLAVTSTHRGQRLGEYLLLDALRRCYTIAAALGLYAVEALAINESARQFYLKYGFESLLDDPLHLCLTMAKVYAMDTTP